MSAEKDIDRIVQERFFAEEADVRRTLIEVGAARPDYLSISASFRDLGWRVVSIEPNPQFCDMHRALGHEILQYACSDADRDGVDFFVVDSNHAVYLGGQVSFESFSSLGIEGGFARELETTKVKTSVSKIKVDVRRLDTLLAEHMPGVAEIDLVAVDVEGWELSVMRGLNLRKYRPRVVILENLFKSRSYRAYMRSQGYRRWKRLKPNEVYVRKDVMPGLWRRLVSMLPMRQA